MRKSPGFTLIELMIVVTVIAILASVAYPSYQSYVRKARRSAAQQVLLGAANKQEQYLLEMRQYTNSFVSLNYKADDWDCTSVATKCTNNFYDITMTVNNLAAPPTYKITATPKGSQASDGNLTIDSTGTKTGNW